MCRKDDFTSTTTQFVLSQNFFPPMLPSQTCFILLVCPGLWNTLGIRCCRTCRKWKRLRRSLVWLGHWRVTVIWVQSTENEHCFWLGMYLARRCAGTGGRCSVSRRKHGHPKTFASCSELRSSRDHTRLPKLFFALAMALTMNARRCQ